MPDPSNIHQFVQLNRTFRELSKDGDDDGVDIGVAYFYTDRMTWADLISKFRVVVLSEAGTGKTEEIRHIAETLRREGKKAFFLRLEHIPQDIEDAFEAGSWEEFQEWLASDDEGWLLLDSVDEARLRHPGDFELAIRKLGRRISAAYQRAHVVITGRTTAWRPKTDLDHCTRHLPFDTSTKTVVGDHPSGPDRPQRIAGANHEHHPVDQDPP